MRGFVKVKTILNKPFYFENSTVWGGKSTKVRSEWWLDFTAFILFPNYKTEVSWQ